MKRILVLVSILALQFSMGGLALAADDDDSKPGLYLQGAFMGQAKTLDDIDPSVDSDSTYGGSLAVGYFLTDFLALQGRLGFMSSPVNLGPGVDSWMMTYTVGVKLYPFNLGGSAGGLLQPYAIAALGGQTWFASADVGSGTNLSDSETAFLLELGGGLDLMFTDNLGVFGEVTYNYLNYSTSDWWGPNESWSGNGVGYQIGITYRF